MFRCLRIGDIETYILPLVVYSHWTAWEARLSIYIEDLQVFGRMRDARDLSGRSNAASKSCGTPLDTTGTPSPGGPLDGRFVSRREGRRGAQHAEISGTVERGQKMPQKDIASD